MYIYIYIYIYIYTQAPYWFIIPDSFGALFVVTKTKSTFPFSLWMFFPPHGARRALLVLPLLSMALMVGTWNAFSLQAERMTEVSREMKGVAIMGITGTKIQKHRFGENHNFEENTTSAFTGDTAAGRIQTTLVEYLFGYPELLFQEKISPESKTHR